MMRRIIENYPVFRAALQMPLSGVREVKPHLPGSWMDRSKDRTGYEINFTKCFYKYKPLRSVEEITKDLLELEKESEGLMNQLFEES